MIVKPAMWWPGIRRGHPLARDLVGCWPLWEGSGGHTVDLSDRANHGTLTNGPLWAGSGMGTCLDFGGTNEYVVMPHDAKFNFAGSPWSMIIWIRPHFDLNDTSGTDKVMAAKTRVAAQKLAWFWKLDEATDKQQFAGLNIGAGITFNVFGTATDWDANVWYQLGIVVDAAGGIEFFRNGVSDGTDTGVVPLTSDSNFGLGYNFADGNQPFDGDIAMFMCWTRALVASEIAELYYNPWSPITRGRGVCVYAPPATEWYYLYRGEGGISEVDFSSEVATVAAGNSSRIFTGLGHLANTRYTYVLRPARTLSDDSVLITPDYSCRVEFETDGSTEWLGDRPGGVEGLSAEIISGGQIRLRWRYRTPYGGSAPNDFGIYYGTSPDITPGSPNTTESYTADGEYSVDLTLTDGTAYYFAVTARDSTPVESHLSDVIGPFIADDTAPDAPTLITAATF